MKLAGVGMGLVVVLGVAACGDGSGKAPPPTQSSTVEVPFQINTYYALEQTNDEDYVARARYYDVLQAADVFGNAGTIALSPGDSAWADGKRLDIETRTESYGVLRVDYSQKVPKGKTRYAFELRRPNESITASIPVPTDFALKATPSGPDMVELTWPPLKSANVLVKLVAKNGCALFEEGALQQSSPDITGRYLWVASSYRSPTQDCDFEIVVERHERGNAAATWKKGSTSLPTNGVHVEAVRAVSVPITLPKRTN